MGSSEAGGTLVRGSAGTAPPASDGIVILLHCTGCRQDRIPAVFRTYTDQLADGTRVRRLRRHCKDCETEAAKERYRRRLVREGRALVREVAARQLVRRRVEVARGGDLWGDPSFAEVWDTRVRMQHGL